VPHKFDPQIKRFVNDTGIPVPRGAIRNEIRALGRHVSKKSSDLALDFQQGNITLGQFQSAMGTLLNSGHIIAASIGRGGVGRMSKSDWSSVGDKIAWQNKYLARFARRIGAGTVSPAMTNYRAGLYSSALWSTFNKTFHKTMKEESALGKNAELCRLVTNSEEGCTECAFDESLGWISVDDMDPIGSRICGDFCKCDIEFEGDDASLNDFLLDVDFDIDAALDLDDDIAFSPEGLTARQRFQLRQKIKKADISIAKLRDRIDGGAEHLQPKLVQLLAKRAKYADELAGGGVVPPPIITPPPPVLPPPPPPPPVTPPPGGGLTARQRFQVRQQIKKVEVRIAKLEQDVANGKTHLRKSLEAAKQKRVDLMTKLTGEIPKAPDILPGVQPTIKAGDNLVFKPGEQPSQAFLRTVDELAEAKRQENLQRLVQLEERVEATRKIHDEALAAHRAYTSVHGYGTTGGKEIQDAWYAASGRMNAAMADLRVAQGAVKIDNDTIRKLLHVNDPMDIRGDFDRLGKGAVRKRAEEGLAEIKRLTSKKAFEDVGAPRRTGAFGEQFRRATNRVDSYKIRFFSDTQRAYQIRDEVHISTSGHSSTVSTVMHEIAHTFEAQSHRILQMSNEFLDYRAGGELPKWLGGSYRKDETARFDKFSRPYMGKLYGRVGQQTATELISMGIEEIYRDAAAFARSDPDYFNFMYKILRGTKWTKADAIAEKVAREAAELAAKAAAKEAAEKAAAAARKAVDKVAEAQAKAGSTPELDERVGELLKKTATWLEDRGAFDENVYIDFAAETAGQARSAAELRQIFGGPIRTADLYGKDRPQIPEGLQRHMSKYAGKKELDIDAFKWADITEMDISELNVTQNFVFEKPLRASSGDKVINVWRYKGQNYFVDGNHTVAKRFLMGKKTVRVRIYEVED
jgi:chorismate mutase